MPSRVFSTWRGRVTGIALCCLASAATVLAVIANYSSRTAELIPSHAPWTATGKFIPGGAYAYTKLAPSVDPPEFHALQNWGSWAGNDANTGEIASPAFRAPRVLGMFVSGYPSLPQNGIYLERLDTHARLPLTIPAQVWFREEWKECYWDIPAGWRGARTRLIALDHETAHTGWLGISTPWAATFGQLARKQLPLALSILLLYPVKLVFFLLPGFAIAVLLMKRRELTAVQMMAAVLTASATFGYLAFWAYFASKGLGRSFSLVLMAASIVPLAWRRRDLWRCFSAIREPLLCVLILGICYLGWFYGFAYSPNADENLGDTRFFEQVRPGDNIIPFIFGDKIYRNEPLKPFCCNDWLSSDRPPLQAGIFLLSRRFDLVKSPGFNYQLLGTGLQCLSICGIWSLLTAMGAAKTRIRQVLGFLAFSGFLFYNSTYVWPKLLAATFIFLVMALLYEAFRAGRPVTTLEGILAAMSLGLAVMAHPGSIFSLGVLLAAVLWRRRLVPLRIYAVAALLLALYAMPWTAYQKFYDPPGNRLTKMHLAGVIKIDERSTWQAVRDAYSTRDLKTILLSRWMDLKGIVGSHPVEDLGFGSIQLHPDRELDRVRLETTRLLEKDYIWNTIGVLNIGWLVAPFVLFRAREAALPHAGWLIAAALFNFFLWCMVMFGPGRSAVELSSFTDILLLTIGLLGCVLSLPKPVVLALAAVQLASLAIVWIWSAPFGQEGALFLAQLPTFTLGWLCAIGLIWYFGKSFLRTE